MTNTSVNAREENTPFTKPSTGLFTSATQSESWHSAKVSRTCYKPYNPSSNGYPHQHNTQHRVSMMSSPMPQSKGLRLILCGSETKWLKMQ